MTSVLLNLRLASEVAHAKELEAFRTMSAFFVHDLKNAAASLNLMLKNLPVHFDDPAFREDALRGIGNTARRIDEMIAPLERPSAAARSVRVEADLNQLVSEALDRVDGMPNVELTQGASAAAQDSGRPRTDPERRDQPGAQRARRAGPGRPHSGPHGASRRPRRSVCRGQWLRDEPGVPEGLLVSPVSEHEEEGARHRPVSVPGDRPGARGRHAGRKRARQRHDVSGELSGQRRDMTKPTLLIVEDDEDIRTQMKWALGAGLRSGHGRGPSGSGGRVHGQPSFGDAARSGTPAAPE